MHHISDITEDTSIAESKSLTFNSQNTETVPEHFTIQMALLRSKVVVESPHIQRVSVQMLDLT